MFTSIPSNIITMLSFSIVHAPKHLAFSVVGCINCIGGISSSVTFSLFLHLVLIKILNSFNPSDSDNI